LTAEIVRVNKLMDEFDRYSLQASESQQSQLILVIPDLQRILRNAQDQDVPACLQALKEFQTAHMDVMIQVLIYLNGHPVSAASPDPNVIANVDSGITRARALHEKYGVELSRLLDTALVTPPAPSDTATTVDQPALPNAIVIAAVFVFLGSILGFTGYHLRKGKKRNREVVLFAEEKQGGIDSKRLHDIYELTSVLSNASSCKHALELALDISVSALKLDMDWVVNDPLAGMAMLFDDGKLHIGAAHRPTGSGMNIIFDGANGMLKRVSDEKEEMILFKDMAMDLKLGCATALRNYKSGYSLPICSDFNIYGILLFVHPDENYFNVERRSILKVVGRQLTTAIENINLYQGLTEEKEHIIESYEEARRKLVDKVHAGPTQSIVDMVARLNTTKQTLKTDVKAAIEEITKLEELAQSAIQEISHMPVLLRPLTLESQGLAATLQVMADQMKELYNQRVIFDVDGDISNQFDLDKQNLIFYIIEEAVDNARKHAAAEIIAIRLCQTEEEIATLQIVDNGVGFDMDAIAQPDDKLPNMVNLRERAKLVQGLLQVDSMPGQGTIVQVHIPLPEAAKDRLSIPFNDYFLPPQLTSESLRNEERM
jgi:signal transduction histidine kinase